jgi:hypothetical protein
LLTYINAFIGISVVYDNLRLIYSYRTAGCA